MADGTVLQLRPCTRTIAKALKRCRGEKRRFSLLEDNDPAGFKSKGGISAKASLNIQPLPFPTYSPDLYPCDFAWC